MISSNDDILKMKIAVLALESLALNREETDAITRLVNVPFLRAATARR